MELSIPFPKSPSGKVLQQCPSSDCRPRRFLTGGTKWQEGEKEIPPKAQRIPLSGKTTCPYCGTNDTDDAFSHPDDIKHTKDLVEAAIAADVNNAIADTFGKSFKQINRSGLVKISGNVKKAHFRKPFAWREDLLRNIGCSQCQRNYAVYALALFCPDCGAPNVLEHFDREAEIIEAQLVLADKAVEDQKAELSYRLIANGHEDVVTAMEAILKTVFNYLRKNYVADMPQPRGAIFQKLNLAGKEFIKLKVNLFTYSDESAVARMQDNLQRRHLIGHNLGIVDEKFKDFDEGAAVGKTVDVSADGVRQFLADVRSMVQSLEDALLSQRNTEQRND